MPRKPKPKYFTAFSITPAGTRTFRMDDFKRYWEGLTAKEQLSLKHKASWEHMTLTAVAIEWGAVENA